MVHTRRNLRCGADTAVLLFNADYYGTLAAVRDLGAYGAEVIVADPRRLPPAQWSKYVTRRLRCPPETTPREFLEWLIEFGTREPGHVLIPTSDAVMFLCSAKQAELSRHFRMYQPTLDSLIALLDKKRLHESARRVGIETPAAWFPRTENEVADLGRDVPFPALLKLRTQVLSRTLSKGAVVRDPEKLASAFASFTARNPFDPLLHDHWPDAGRPMIQEYLPRAADRIYCISAFISRGGTHMAMRAAVKVLSRPRHLGVGLCVEPADLDHDLAERLIELCRDVGGYFGMFQCEFLLDGPRKLLIDFNPRCYNWMALTIARGLRLPTCFLLGALEKNEELARELERAKAGAAASSGLVFCHQFSLMLQNRIQRLLWRIPRDETRHWKRWKASARRVVDPVWQRGDSLPGVTDVCMQLQRAVRHPRSFLRSMLEV